MIEAVCRCEKVSVLHRTVRAIPGMSVFNPYRVDKVRDFHAEPIQSGARSLADKRQRAKRPENENSTNILLSWRNSLLLNGSVAA
jgi:hypothetical protein